MLKGGRYHNITINITTYTYLWFQEFNFDHYVQISTTTTSDSRRWIIRGVHQVWNSIF